MPLDGAIQFSDLTGKLDVLRVSCEICGRDGCYGLNRLIEKRGRDEEHRTQHERSVWCAVSAIANGAVAQSSVARNQMANEATQQFAQIFLRVDSDLRGKRTEKQINAPPISRMAAFHVGKAGRPIGKEGQIPAIRGVPCGLGQKDKWESL
jgi:hypothetical protein